jgi:hypothetical protein
MKATCLVTALMLAVIVPPIRAQETVDTRIGKLQFESGYPSRETVAKLYDEMDFQRACQAYLWGIPAVGIAEWQNAPDNVIKASSTRSLPALRYARGSKQLLQCFVLYWLHHVDVEAGFLRLSPILVLTPTGQRH